jgi:hypothetical protein
MPSNTSLTTAQVLAVFIEEITARGGKVTRMYGDEQRLFARSVLPLVEEVRPGDRIRAGVALRATKQDVALHPYLFRLICSNGAIVSKALESRTLENVFQLSADEATRVIREGIEAASLTKEVFANTIRKIRESRRVQASETEVAAFRFSMRDAVSREAIARFARDGDHSRYGLANAITSVARDVRRPRLQWDLEELGGAILVGTPPKSPIDGEMEAVAPLPRLLEVG